MKLALRIAAAALAVLVAVVAIRCARFESKQIRVDPVAPIAVDTDGLARRPPTPPARAPRRR